MREAEGCRRLRFEGHVTGAPVLVAADELWRTTASGSLECDRRITGITCLDLPCLTGRNAERTCTGTQQVRANAPTPDRMQCRSVLVTGAVTDATGGVAGVATGVVTDAWKNCKGPSQGLWLHSAESIQGRGQVDLGRSREWSAARYAGCATRSDRTRSCAVWGWVEERKFQVRAGAGKYPVAHQSRASCLRMPPTLACGYSLCPVLRVLSPDASQTSRGEGAEDLRGVSCSCESPA